MIYKKVIEMAVNNEKTGIDYNYPNSDKPILDKLLKTINKHAKTNFKYLAELDWLCIRGVGHIIAEYFSQFSSHTIREILIPLMICDKIQDCDKIILDSYIDFKKSKEYISEPGKPSPAHIHTSYDNALKTLKPRRLKEDLLNLAYEPRDVFYLPFTMKMLASWKIPTLKELFISYSSENNVSAHDVGLQENDERMPPLSFISRQLRFTSIQCLKYYPSDDVTELLKKYTNEADSDIRATSKKVLNYFEKTKVQ